MTDRRKTSAGKRSASMTKQFPALKPHLTDTIRTFTALGASLLEARSDGTPLEMAVASSVAWDRLAQLVATGTQLSNTLADEPLLHMSGRDTIVFVVMRPGCCAGRCLKLEAAPVAGPLVAAALSIGEMKGVASPERRFLRPSSKWNRHLRVCAEILRVFGSGGTLSPPGCFSFRRCLASPYSRRYGDLKQYWCR